LGYADGGEEQTPTGRTNRVISRTPLPAKTKGQKQKDTHFVLPITPFALSLWFDRLTMIGGAAGGANLNREAPHPSAPFPSGFWAVFFVPSRC